ncbi:hypothetical protein [Streptomyces sp. NPDC056660]|uniref:hypothetical protein n=1 Tax=Streptomyces sp. NPDC056660 TaxID=3345897 RepID=UPI0036CC90DF
MARSAARVTTDRPARYAKQLAAHLGRHLVRFGTRDELLVEWHRDNGEPGTTQSN